jgi:condensin complex subunit 2
LFFASDIANLNAKKFDLEFAVDPLFRKTSAAFEAGGPRGLLLNHLSVQNGREIIFDSTDAVKEDDSGSGDLIAFSDCALDLKELHKLVADSLGGKSLENMEISPDFFPDFKFRAADATEKRNEPDLVDIHDDEAEADDALDEDLGNLDADFGDADHINEQEKRLQEEQREIAFPIANAALLDIPDHDHHHHDDDDDHHHGGGMDLMDMDEDAPVPADRPRSPPRSPSRRKSGGGAGVQVVDMFDIENPLLKDYNYFDLNKLNAWSGPQHWKYRHTFQKKKTGDADGEDGENVPAVAEAAGVDRTRIGASNARGAGAARQPPKKKAAFSIDFSKPMPDDEFARLFEGNSRSTTTLSKKNLADAERDAKSLTLVPDVGYDPEKLISLFLKPSMKITSRSRRSPNRRNSLLKNGDCTYISGSLREKNKILTEFIEQPILRTLDSWLEVLAMTLMISMTVPLTFETMSLIFSPTTLPPAIWATWEALKLISAWD